MKKEDFLNKLRKNTHVQFDMPAVDVKGILILDTLQIGRASCRERV